MTCIVCILINIPNFISLLRYTKFNELQSRDRMHIISIKVMHISMLIKQLKNLL